MNRDKLREAAEILRVVYEFKGWEWVLDDKERKRRLPTVEEIEEHILAHVGKLDRKGRQWDVTDWRINIRRAVEGTYDDTDSGSVQFSISLSLGQLLYPARARLD